jgi:hypothetical protein
MSVSLRGRGVISFLILATVLAAPSVQASVIPSGVDVWFGTSTPTIAFKRGFQYLGPGSILSISGKVIASNAQLLANFKPSFAIPLDRGLDALAVTGTKKNPMPLFSTGRSFYSRTLNRMVSDGDLLNSKGQVVATNKQLVEAFKPKGANFGLDLIWVRSTDGQNGPEYWFSTNRSFYSNALGKMVSSNDILSNRGQIVATAADLLGAFKPRSGTGGIGIDSLIVHQESDSKEVFWFSTTKDFYSTSLKRMISSCDLIASNGTVLLTKRDFMKNFGFVLPICRPLELRATALTPPDGEPKPAEPATVCLLLAGALLATRRRRR